MSKETNNFPAQAGHDNQLNNSIDNSVGKKTSYFSFHFNLGSGKSVAAAITVAGAIAAALIAAIGTSKQKAPLSEPTFSRPAKVTPQTYHAPGGIPSLLERNLPEKKDPSLQLPEASKEKPFVNSLSMGFVPVRIAPQEGPFSVVLACRHETRVKDFRAFVEESNKTTVFGEYEAAGGGMVRGSWKEPGFPQKDDHPVVWISHEEAITFCGWLTRRERKLGTISPKQEYRLPRAAEWIQMFEDEHGPIVTFFEKIEGNWADTSLDIYASQPTRRFPWRELGILPIPYYDDGVVWTEAVGKSQERRNPARNLWDLPGNVWEFTLATQASHGDFFCKIMGGAWNYGIQDIDSPSEDLKEWCSRGNLLKCSTRHYSVGFRCILAAVAYPATASAR